MFGVYRNYFGVSLKLGEKLFTCIFCHEFTYILFPTDTRVFTDADADLFLLNLRIL